MTDESAPPLVQTAEALEAVIAQLSDAETIALDTEFHAERRYRPELMLLQLAAPDGPVFTIDPLKLDLRPLRLVLHDRHWVAHGCRWDIVLIHDATGARPSRLTDTQLLAGMAGLHYPARLDHLTREVLGHELGKGSTLSDWSRRPLDPDQLAYARDDVRLLCPLQAALTERIEQLDQALLGRDGVQWAAQAGMELVETALAAPDPDRIWQSMDIAPDLDEATRQVLHAIYRWREGEAERRNVPTHFVLAPSIALDLARRRPSNEAQLRANRRIPASVIKRYRTDLLAAIHAGLQRPAPPPVVDHRRGGRLPFLSAWWAVMADQLAIAPQLLASRELLRSVASHGADALQGWRALALKDALTALMEGRTTLRFSSDGAVEAVPKRH